MYIRAQQTMAHRFRVQKKPWGKNNVQKRKNNDRSPNDENGNKILQSSLN